MIRYPLRSGLVAVLAITLFAGVVTVAVADEPFNITQGQEIEWSAGPDSLPEGAQMKVLAGNPGEKGPFVVRFRFPANYTVAMHTHPMVENLTVISGALQHDLGNDDAEAQEVKAGDFIYLPADTPHSVRTTNDAAVLQLTAVGPFKIEYVDASNDPRKAK